MNSSVAGFPAPRVTPNLIHAFGGIWRLTIRKSLTSQHWLAVAGMLAILGLICFGFLSAGNGPQVYLNWSVGFYFTFLVPVMAFITAAGAMRDEMKPGTVDFVLTRPVPRRALVVFKYLAHLACAQVDFLCAFSVVVGLGLFRHAPGLFPILPSLLFAQVLLVAAFSAFGFFCGVLTSRYIILGLVYASIIEIGIGQIPTQLNRLSMTHQVKAMLQPLMAGAGRFFPATEAIPDATMFATACLLLGFSVIMLALATVVFTARELTGPTES